MGTLSSIPLIKVQKEGREWDRGNRTEEICMRISQNKANISIQEAQMNPMQD